MNWKTHFRTVSEREVSSRSAGTATFGGLLDVDPQTGQSKVSVGMTWAMGIGGVLAIAGAAYYLGESLERERYLRRYEKKRVEASGTRLRAPPLQAPDEEEMRLRGKALAEALARTPKGLKQAFRNTGEMSKTARVA
jgi:hypothetical protein